MTRIFNGSLGIICIYSVEFISLNIHLSFFTATNCPISTFYSFKMQLTLKLRAYVAEFIGTFFLTFAVLVSINSDFPISTPVIAALTLGLFVYSVGHVSGTHINPAVTIGLASIRKIDVANAVAYIVSQFLGAGVAMLLAGAVIVDIEGVTQATNWTIFLAEIIGTAIFTFGIASVVYAKANEAMSGLVVGGSLLLGISLSVGLGAAGVLNPAVAVGLGAFSSAYALGPIVGSIIGFNVYAFIRDRKANRKADTKIEIKTEESTEKKESRKDKKKKNR